MNYNDAKKEILNDFNSVLVAYDLLFMKANKVLFKYMKNEDKIEKTKDFDPLDFLGTIYYSNEKKKLFRLLSALYYVEDPNDKVAIENLINNIEMEQLGPGFLEKISDAYVKTKK